MALRALLGASASLLRQSELQAGPALLRGFATQTTVNGVPVEVSS